MRSSLRRKEGRIPQWKADPELSPWFPRYRAKYRHKQQWPRMYYRKYLWLCTTGLVGMSRQTPRYMVEVLECRHNTLQAFRNESLPCPTLPCSRKGNCFHIARSEAQSKVKSQLKTHRSHDQKSDLKAKSCQFGVLACHPFHRAFGTQNSTMLAKSRTSLGRLPSGRSLPQWKGWSAVLLCG